MKWTIVIVVLLGVAVVLGVALAVRYGQLEEVAAQPVAPSAVQPKSAPGRQAAVPEVEPNATRTNEGGAVTFEVTPLSLDGDSETLDFEIVMNTHSVDLGFDLAKLALLRTDRGVEVVPSAYQGGSGHHVTGRLSFPATETTGARTLTLLIRDVAGVAEREFVWDRQ